MHLAFRQKHRHTFLWVETIGYHPVKSYTRPCQVKAPRQLRRQAFVAGAGILILGFGCRQNDIYLHYLASFDILYSFKSEPLRFQACSAS